MAGSSAQQRRLLAQAIHGFAQRHPELTMASVELCLADALSLSPASVQKRGLLPVTSGNVE